MAEMDLFIAFSAYSSCSIIACEYYNGSDKLGVEYIGLTKLQ